MDGTFAITDFEWYEFLRDRPDLNEVNFWKPSARRAFKAPEFSPFFFKLRAPHNAICGFGYFARYTRLPDWLAWECFEEANGCTTLDAMRSRIHRIREGMRYRPGDMDAEIGCILVVEPTFFAPDAWIPQPTDWPVRTQTTKGYDLTVGQGLRVWEACRDRMAARDAEPVASEPPTTDRFGTPRWVTPRLGQGTFRVAVTEAYGRGCAMTGEHSLPALEAAHIKPYSKGGPHAVPNGLCLRADLHRLFDRGYLTVTPDLNIEVSGRLRDDYHNGRSYYPLHGQGLRAVAAEFEKPSSEYLGWHNENVYRG